MHMLYYEQREIDFVRPSSYRDNCIRTFQGHHVKWVYVVNKLSFLIRFLKGDDDLISGSSNSETIKEL